MVEVVPIPKGWTVPRGEHLDMCLNLPGDLADWARKRDLPVIREWMDGLGNFVGVDLLIDGEPVLLEEYEERPGLIMVTARWLLPDRARATAEMLRLLGFSGPALSTETGETVMV